MAHRIDPEQYWYDSDGTRCPIISQYQPPVLTNHKDGTVTIRLNYADATNLLHQAADYNVFICDSPNFPVGSAVHNMSDAYKRLWRELRDEVRDPFDRVEV